MEKKRIARQAYAGLLWSKQFYHYVVRDWLEGDKDQPPPPQERKHGRNKEWGHLFNRDVISMPDKWEYPWVCVICVFLNFTEFQGILTFSFPASSSMKNDGFSTFGTHDLL